MTADTSYRQAMTLARDMLASGHIREARTRYVLLIIASEVPGSGIVWAARARALRRILAWLRDRRSI